MLPISFLLHPPKPCTRTTGGPVSAGPSETGSAMHCDEFGTGLISLGKQSASSIPMAAKGGLRRAWALGASSVHPILSSQAGLSRASRSVSPPWMICRPTAVAVRDTQRRDRGIASAGRSTSAASPSDHVASPLSHITRPPATTPVQARSCASVLAVLEVDCD